MAKLKYNPDTFPLLVEQYARDGLNDYQIYGKLGISKDTFYKYLKIFPDFLAGFKKGREPVNTKVENSLLKRALGYEYEEKTTELRIDNDGNPKPAVIRTVKKHIPPDVGAMAFWLKNRKPDEWREKQEITTKIINELNDKTDEELRAMLKE